jgi:hypothetical protein
MRETSLAFRHALLKSEKKRIVGVIVFVCYSSIRERSERMSSL